VDNHINIEPLSCDTKCHPIYTLYRVIGTAFCYLLFGLGALVLSIALSLVKIMPIKKDVKRQWTRSVISQGCIFLLNTTKYLGLLSYSMKPTPKISPRGKLIIANHPSLLDALFILGMCKNLCCIAKSALWKNPFTASLVRMADYIPNNSNDFIAETKQRLERGENILIFPEGSRNSYDNQLAFKRGAANIAILTESDIVPILIKCSPRAMQKGEKLYNIPTTAPLFSFEVLPTIETKKHIRIGSPKTLQYRQLTNYLIETYRPHLTTIDK
jgi:1-acyl-sn-glycerol-3-phosphate acyltransferase